MEEKKVKKPRKNRISVPRVVSRDDAGVSGKRPVKTAGTLSSSAEASAVTRALKARVRQCEALIRSYQLQIASIRKEMDDYRLAAIMKGLARSSPGRFEVTSDDDDRPHPLLQMAHELNADPDSAEALPYGAACGYEPSGVKPGAPETAIAGETAAPEPGSAVKPAGGESRPGCAGDARVLLAKIADLMRDNEELKTEVERMKMRYDVLRKLSVEREEKVREEIGAFELALKKMEKEKEALERETRVARAELALRDGKAGGGEAERGGGKEAAADATWGTGGMKPPGDMVPAGTAAAPHQMGKADSPVTGDIVPAGTGAAVDARAAEALDAGRVSAPETHAGEGSRPEEASGHPVEMRRLVEKVNREPTVENLFALRQWFMRSGRYEEGVKVFRGFFAKPKNHRLLPSICLVVGELLKLSGRGKEAAFYLGNPMVKNDSFAQYLMRNLSLAGAAADERGAGGVVSPKGERTQT
ncbi:MAG: hypothetical protein AB1742_06735 [bacterium]